ncbi:MAG: acyl carrier protein [Chthoniobacterales bacterium]|jgi:acyl carrier protein
MKRDEFLETLAVALELDRTQLNDQYRLAYASWDSLLVMSTVAAVDQHFDIILEPEELYECASVKALFDLLKRKGVDLE